MMLVDAHLDLAYNASRGRDLTLPAAQQQPNAEGTPTVGLPDLAAGGVGLVCATMFVAPVTEHTPNGYRTPAQANEQCVRQLDWYKQQVAAGRLRQVRSRSELPRQPQSPTPFILLMEGADALRNEQNVGWWWRQGLRIVGLAWRRTLHAGGTGEPGGLTDLGRRTAQTLDHVGMIHDVSHLAEQAFWELLEIIAGPAIASHSNARAIIPTDRHLSDEMAQALVKRGGMIGINLYDRFLISPKDLATRPASLADAVRHFKHFADLLGSCSALGIGSDLDGGFGREHSPREINSIAELPRLADALSAGGFGYTDIQGILGGHWLEYFSRNLPG
jgi:membrane dipeptidase